MTEWMAGLDWTGLIVVGWLEWSAMNWWLIDSRLASRKALPHSQCILHQPFCQSSCPLHRLLCNCSSHSPMLWESCLPHSNERPLITRIPNSTIQPLYSLIPRLISARINQSVYFFEPQPWRIAVPSPLLSLAQLLFNYLAIFIRYAQPKQFLHLPFLSILGIRLVVCSNSTFPRQFLIIIIMRMKAFWE